MTRLLTLLAILMALTAMPAQAGIWPFSEKTWNKEEMAHKFDEIGYVIDQAKYSKSAYQRVENTQNHIAICRTLDSFQSDIKKAIKLLKKAKPHVEAIGGFRTQRYNSLMSEYNRVRKGTNWWWLNDSNC